MSTSLIYAELSVVLSVVKNSAVVNDSEVIYVGQLASGSFT